MGKNKLTIDIEDYKGGTTTWWKHPLYTYTYTDGVKAIAEDVGAYWLIDTVFSKQGNPELENEPFQVWDWIVIDEKGRFIVSDGNGNVIANYTVLFTDFPEGSFTFWFTDEVLLLPVEY